MSKHAVLLTVLFALVVSLLSVSVVFWEFFKLNKKQYINNIFTKHAIITQVYTQHLQEKNSKVMLDVNLAVYKLHVDYTKSIKELSTKGKLLKRIGFQSVENELMFNANGFYTQRVVNNIQVSMFTYLRKIYFYIQTPKGNVLIEDEVLRPYRYFNVLYTYSTVIFIISMSFFLILHRLRPLIRLRRKIATLGDGNMEVSFKMTGNDEISSIANELESTKGKINSIMESRTLFLRNIMHELKTPIAKGTIATQMLKTDKQRDRFTSIFGRLESLVNEFALIEEVTSLDDKSEFKEYRLVDMIDGAIDMAMVDKMKVFIDVNANVKINANYRLYTTAIKNMIDNGMKYSPDEMIYIKMVNSELCFDTKGDCLSQSLKYYIEPFTKENPSKNSFGLGLYLVDSILKAHDQVLAHEYHDGINRFIFA